MRILLILGWLLISGILANAGNDVKSAPEGQSRADELLQRLQSLGSFQAEYYFATNGKPVGNITTIFDRQYHYLAIKLSDVAGKDPDVFTLVDISKMDSTNGGLEIAIIQGKRGQKCLIPIQKMIETPDNPIGILCLIGKYFGAAENSETNLPTLDQVAPNLSLGIDDDSINISAGFSTLSTNLTVSWLDRGLISNAVNVIEGDETVQFVYPSNHVIVVDKTTGLLSSDTVGDIESKRGSVREIVFKRDFTPVNQPYSALIPNFHKVKFKELPTKNILGQLYFSYFASMGQQMASDTNFTLTLQSNSVKLAKAARDAARQMTHEKARAAVTKKKNLKALDKILIPAYKEYLANPPIDIRDLSFTNLLDLALAAMSDDSKLLPPDLLESVNKARNESKSIIEFLPDDSRRALNKYLDVIYPALCQGVLIEFTSISFDDIKKMQLPNMAPLEAKAYCKRAGYEIKHGMLNDAITDLERALELKPSDPEIEKQLTQAKAKAKENKNS